MTSTGLLLKWSWRDLRHRWLLVTAIALVIALGTGLFAAYQSMTTWRRESNDASFAALTMHDVRVRLADGAFVSSGTLLDLLDGIPAAASVDQAQERLIFPTQIDASTPEETILVSGEIVGLDTRKGGPTVDKVHVFEGDGLVDGAAVLDTNFARFHDLASTGTVLTGPGRELPYSGIGVAPEYVFITGGERGGLFAEASYAVLYTPLDLAQDLAGRPDEVNDLVLTLQPRSDLDAIVRQLESALDDHAIGGTVLTREDDYVYTTLYEDIGNDQKLMTMMAVLILAGAGFASFNLITRIVEAQRREIGIGMALGAEPRRLALRPLLVGAQIALLGALAGLGLGYLASSALAGVLEDFFPLPIWVTDLAPGPFLQAMAVGVLVPMLAVVLPVWRAIRVEPADAIRTGWLSARDTGALTRARGLHVPGLRSWWEMPQRNILRTPRRTLLTALGIAAAITSLVTILGMIDTFMGGIRSNEDELTRTTPDRMIVELDTFHRLDSPTVTTVLDDPTVGRAEPGLRLGGTVTDGTDVELLVEVLDLDAAMWTPTLEEAVEPNGEPGLLLSRKAADDLDVAVGDHVDVRHPVIDPAVGVRLTTTSLRVDGIHASAMRFQAYMDVDDTSVFGMTGLANIIMVEPADGSTQADVQRALFGQPGIGAVQPAAQLAKLLDDALSQFVGLFQVIEFAVLMLALLIAFNSTSIAVDERAREHATMFAFGLRLRTVLATMTLESVVTGVLGTIVGLLAGYGVLRWIIAALLPTTLPEFGLAATIGSQTIWTAAMLGIVAVAVAPALTVRRLRRMDIPSTLRVVE